MCTFHTLSQSEKIQVKWCSKCDCYSLYIQNVVLQFRPPSLQGFKDNLEACYQHYASITACRDERTILFNTRLEGLQLLFSFHEVGALIAQLQEAEWSKMSLSDEE